MKNIEALERFADIIISKIEKTSKDWRQPWFGASDKRNGMPRNISGRQYNASNSIMLMLYCEAKRFSNPVFLTFHQVQTLNEGQPEDKHIKILPKEKAFPVVLRTKMYKDGEGNFIYQSKYDELPEEEQDKWTEIYTRKVYTVFNVHQTNMESVRPDLWQKITADGKAKRTPAEGELLASFEIMKERNEWVCPIRNENGNGAYFSKTKNEIVLPFRNQFTTTENYYGTAFHEMAHSTGVPLKRKTMDNPDHAEEELVAELTAALVCAGLGFSRHINEDSVPYLKSWIETLKAKPEYIKNILDDVQKAEHMISEKVDAYEGCFYIELAA